MKKQISVMSSTLVHSACVAVLLSSLVTGCDRADPVNHLQNAREYLSQGKPESAVLELKTALQVEPDNVEARRLLGSTALTLEDPATAEKELQRALELGAPPELVLLQLARARLDLNKTEELVENAERPSGELQASLQLLSPADAAELYSIYGAAYIARDNAESARAMYEKALTLDPESPHAKTGLAGLTAQAGDLPGAVAQMQQILERHPEYGEGWGYLGTLYRLGENLEPAEEAYSRAIELGSRNPGIYLGRALVRIAGSNFKDAEGDLKYVGDNYANVVEVPYARGVIAVVTDRLPEARDQFNNALKLKDDDPRVLLMLGLTEATLGQGERAEELLTRFLRTQAVPSQATDAANKALARLRGQRGDFDGAETALTSVLEHAPDDPEALDLMSNVAMRQGDSLAATELLRKAISDQVASGRTLLKLGAGLLEAGDVEGAQAVMLQAEGYEDSRDSARAMRFATYLDQGEHAKALALADELRQAQPENAWAHALVGIAHIAGGDEDAARTALQRSLELSPGNLPASHNLALIEMTDGNFDAARKLYADVLAKDPNNADVPALMARLELRAGNPAEVTRWKERTVEVRPEEIIPRVLLARDYLGRGEPQRALEALQPVASRGQDNVLFLIHDGLVRLALGQYASAVESYEKAVALQPALIPAQFGLARARAETGDTPGMKKALDTIIETNPAFIPAQMARIRLMVVEKQFDEAAKRIAQLGEKATKAPEIPVLQGELLTAQGKTKEAVEAFKTAFERRADTTHMLLLAEARRRAGDGEGAVGTVKTWLESNPDDLPAWRALAGSQMALGNQDEARKAWQHIVDIAPEDASALNNLAWSLREADPAAARTYAEKALSLAPDNPAVKDTLGVVLTKEGNLERAISLLEEAYTSAQDPLIGYHFAFALAEQGERSRAVRVLERLLGEKREFGSRSAAEALLTELTQ